jgi:hypothetical protein
METTESRWVIMPVMGAPVLTRAAIADVLAQSIEPRLLIVNQGVDREFRQELEQIAETYPERIFLWNHDPSLPSLAATWNRALSFVWGVGGTAALVVNNDVRLHPLTYWHLLEVMRASKALFVSGVGVTEAQYKEATASHYFELSLEHDDIQKGGPDFSCFLLSQEGHWNYPFDEGFIPAYCEDLDTHRRYMLGGDGDRIFSVNLPYHHIGGGSATLKEMSPERRQAHERLIDQSRTHYQEKWGGPVNAERWTIPFDKDTDQDGVTTPDLQHMMQIAAGD